jgi:hypothetical protein
MMSDLSFVELTALSKIVEKAIKEKKDSGETLDPGNYDYNVDLHLEGSLSRGNETKASPPFAMDKFLKALLLRYAQGMADQGHAWLVSILSIDGGLGAVIKMGPDAVIKTVNPTLVSAWETAEDNAKKYFQAITPKSDRAGNTVVAGCLEKVVEAKVTSAKKKPKK